MREPYWHDGTATLYLSDARKVLEEMADGSVDCIVTSPPLWTPHQSGRQPQPGYGHQPTPALYIAALRRVFAEAHRVLSDEGTAWLAISDQYATQTGWVGASDGRHRRTVSDQAMTGLPISSLIGLPWQLAFALHDDGWIIRNSIVCHHPTTEPCPLPEDRFAASYELIFLLVKQQRYHFDAQDICCPLAHPDAAGQHASGSQISTAGNRPDQRGAAKPGEWHSAAAYPSGTQPADVWTVPARSQRDAMPIEVPLCCIAAGCRPGGTVLDMFAGVGATGLAARALGRSYIGIEETESLCRIARHRLRRSAGQENGGAR